MQSIHSDSLWIEIERLATTSRFRVAAVAYFTDDEIIQFGNGDLLVVDASDQAIRVGQTSHSVLQRAFDRGAKLSSCPGLHAKVMVFDDAAVIGSANISQSSQHDLIEAGLVTDDPATVAATRALIEGIASTAEEINSEFLARIATIKVNRTGRGFISVRQPGVSNRPPKPQLWLAGLHSVTEDEKDTEKIARWEADAIKSVGAEKARFSHFWITGNPPIRQKAKRGDLVIEMWRDE